MSEDVYYIDKIKDCHCVSGLLKIVKSLDNCFFSKIIALVHFLTEAANQFLEIKESVTFAINTFAINTLAIITLT